MIVLTSIVFTGGVAAKPMNVVDCLEEDVDCLDGSFSTDGEGSQTEQLIESESTGSLLFSLVKMFFALLLILALIYLLLKFLSKRSKLFHQVKALENLGGVSVGQNKSIQIVRIGTQVFLIGVGENVEMLHEITDNEVIEDLLHSEKAVQNEVSAGTLFSSILRKKSTEDMGSTIQDKGDFKKLFSGELEKVRKNREKLIKQNGQKEDKHE
ncbi:flagellar biosynthetic protein FliO [Virgibacillus sp. C22-A2]|uniref:Flagellar biosynthetic protein FliO n=2 Tax=Virgibacillus tibetensis TaxID=3042313 RepID=A0ABU6KC93_9BACI|nr:flagellar biosynthetic protein FliO [Virgibacillus sp. C22-A2]